MQHTESLAMRLRAAIEQEDRDYEMRMRGAHTALAILERKQDPPRRGRPPKKRARVKTQTKVRATA